MVQTDTLEPQRQTERQARRMVRKIERKTKDSIAQLDKGAMIIAFDENGRMIQFPKQVINRNQVVVFKVQVSKSWFAGQVNTFFTKVDSVYDYFFNHRENQFVLWSLFGDADTLVEKWLGELESYRAYRQELGGDSLYNLATYDARIARKADKYKDELTFLPVAPFINHLLFHQFRIRTYNRNLDITNEVRLKPEFGQIRLEKNDCYWWYSEKMLLDTLLGSHCTGCHNDLRFTLIRENPLQATVTEWYNKQFAAARFPIGTNTTKTAALLKEKLEYLLSESSKLAKLDPQHEDSVHAVINWLAEQVTKVDPDGNLLVKPESLNAFPGTISTVGGKNEFDFKKYLETLREVKYWLFQWLWYNKGFLVTTPIALQAPPAKNNETTLQEQLRESTSRLQNLQQHLDFLDSSRIHLKPQLQNLADINKIQAKSDSISVLRDKINKHIAALKEKLKEDAKAKEQAALSKKQVGITAMQAYAGSIPVYGYKEWYRNRALFPGKLTILKQFTYSNARKSISPIYWNERGKSKNSEIPENEKALLAIHNIPVKSKIDLTHALTGYNDMEEFTILFQKLIKDLDSTGLLQLAMAGPLAGFSNYILNTLGRNSDDVNMEVVARDVGKAISVLKPINAMTADYLKKSAENSPVSLTSNMVVLKKITATTDTSTGYVSNYYTIPDSTAPYMVNSTLLIDSVKAKFNVKVGVLRRTQLAAGFAVVRSPVQQNSIDTTGNGFRTNSSSNNSSAILGVKLYPARTFLRDGSLWPRYPLRRLSVMMAVAVPKPLNNFYLGGGYDLVPGLSYTMGWNIFKQNYYQIQNATVIKSSTRYSNGGVYYGVTVNPIVFVQFVKLFFN